MWSVLPNKQAFTLALYSQFLQHCSKAFQLCLDRKETTMSIISLANA